MRSALAVAALVLLTGMGPADPETGEDIYIVCAPCHGDQAQGGGGGLYPRLAGFSERYLTEQLKAFKSRDRINIPMFPFTTERELPDEDIRDVSAYIAAIELQSRLPPLTGRMDGLERLLQAKRTLQIPRAPGNVERGRALYAEHCARCHGENGEGDGDDDPPLAGQHIPYLEKQMVDMAADERFHPRPRKTIQPFSREDVRDMLAYISILDD